MIDPDVLFRCIEGMTKPQHNGYWSPDQQLTALRLIRTLTHELQEQRYSVNDLREALAVFSCPTSKNNGRRFAAAFLDYLSGRMR